MVRYSIVTVSILCKDHAAIIVGSLPLRTASITTRSCRPKIEEPTDTPAQIRQGGRQMPLLAAGSAMFGVRSMIRPL